MPKAENIVLYTLMHKLQTKSSKLNVSIQQIKRINEKQKASTRNFSNCMCEQGYKNKYALQLCISVLLYKLLKSINGNIRKNKCTCFVLHLMRCLCAQQLELIKHEIIFQGICFTPLLNYSGTEISITADDKSF